MARRILKCPYCGGKLKRYDNTKRIVRSKGRKTHCINVKRFYCKKCGKICRRTPRNLLPHKQYEKEIITGVLENLITSDTLGFENYPCEATMSRWKKEYKNKNF